MSMDVRASLRRRAVLVSAVAAAGFATATAHISGEPVSTALHRLFGRTASLRNFGRIFHARDANAVVRLLARLRGLDGSAVRTRLEALRNEDFAAGRVVVIDGWVLARTEAEVCAYISLA